MNILERFGTVRVISKRTLQQLWLRYGFILCQVYQGLVQSVTTLPEEVSNCSDRSVQSFMQAIKISKS